MPRNLIICCDGTNNEFGIENTSVVRLVEVLNRDPERQLVFYDPGVGTLPEPGLVTRTGKWISKAIGLAFGGGLLSNVSEAYAYLMSHWQPGDRVFIFGFSRGAYSARALASMLHMFGLLPSGNDNLLPYVIRRFKAARRELRKTEAKQKQFWLFCDAFRETFSRAIPESPQRRFPVHFLGVFDTVSSVGWIWNPLSLPFTRRNPSVKTVRHAVAIDEKRCFFRQNLFAQAAGQDLEELWFAGVHSDVGGGYSEKAGGLWREPYLWMLEAAEAAGLETETARKTKVWTARSAVPAEAWKEPQHESLTWKWWIAELLPKWPGTTRGIKRVIPTFGLWRRRKIPANAKFHPSVAKRFRDLASYRPGNLASPPPPPAPAPSGAT